MAQAGCTCADTGVENSRFACATSADCATGYLCSLGECTRRTSCTTSADCAAGFFCDGAGDCSWDGGSAGGGAGGGGGAGPQLVITSPAQSIPIGTCSAPVSFEVRAGATPFAVSAPTEVSIAATPVGSLGLFAGPDCSSAAPLTLAPDASTGSFSFFGGDGGTFSLALSAPGLGGATQPAIVTWPPAAGLAFVTASQTVRAGDCSAAVTVELQDGAGAPAPANAPVVLALSSAPAPGVQFYSDPACTLPITTATVAAGAARTTFYVSRATGLDYTLTAAAAPLSAGLGHRILPIVRSGSCLLAAGDGGVSCPVVPPVLSLSDSFLVYQVASGTEIAGALAVLCELDAVGSISCVRGRTDQDALISWQVAEVKGATVRKASTSCDGGLSVPLASAAPAASSFVLTANQNDGMTVDDSDFNLGQLNPAGTAVDFFFGSVCSGPQSMLAQVVSLPNITVERGTTSLPASIAVRSFNDPPPPQAAVLLAQWKGPVGAGAGICDRSVRPELSGNTLSFSRGNGSASAFCTASALSSLVYEKVDFRATATVQQVLVTMGAGAASATAALTPVDRTRTLVLAGGQGSTGQSLGEGTHLGSTTAADFLGEVSVSLSLGGAGYQSAQLSAARGSTNGASRWGAFVVELIP